MKDKPVYVTFANTKLERSFEKLKKGTYENKQLQLFIDRAIEDLKKDPACGIIISKKLWPKTYIQRYHITNLWKYDLPNAWRLIYTILEDKIMIVNVILEWFSHKEYEKRFRY